MSIQRKTTDGQMGGTKGKYKQTNKQMKYVNMKPFVSFVAHVFYIYQNRLIQQGSCRSMNY